MNLIKIFLSATLLIMAFSMSGCQGNNSDTPVVDTNNSTGGEVVVPDLNVTTLILPVTESTLTINRENLQISVRVESDGAPLSTGSVKVINPSSSLRPDVGYFDSYDVPVDITGQAIFSYNAPERLDDNSSDIVFSFYHTSDTTTATTYVVKFEPVPNQIDLAGYNLKASPDSNLSIGLNSSILVSFFVATDLKTLEDSSLVSMVIETLNPSVGKLRTTTVSSANIITVLDKNNVSVSVDTNESSGIVPLKVTATFKDGNGVLQAPIERVFSLTVLSGPATSIAVGYKDSSHDGALFTDTMVITIKDEYGNLVNTQTSLSASVMSGYAQDSTGPLNYMYHENTEPIAGTLDANTFSLESGVVTQVNITNSGSGYVTAPAVSMAGGDGTFQAESVLNSTGSITALTFFSLGSGYTKAPTISVIGEGSGFSASTNLSSTGGFASIVVDNAGLGYATAPTITATGGGTGFDSSVTLEDTGSIKSVAITTAGDGYAIGDVLPVTGDGSGAIVKVTNISGGGATGPITEVTIFDRGTGYKSGNTAIDGTTLGDKTAKFSVIIGYSLKSVVINNPGIDYSNAGLTISGTPDETAILTGVLSYTLDATTPVTIISGGSGYSTPSISLISDASDSTALVALASATVRYSLNKINILDGGTGYSNGNLVIAAPPAPGVTAQATGTVFSSSEFGNIDDANYKLALFGSGYVYDASGKWDIINNGVLNQLSIVDTFEGSTTSGLGFAVGNNQRDDLCRAGVKWASVASVVGGSVFNTTGLAEIELEYNEYMVAKDVVVMINLIGEQNSLEKTLKIGESSKHTLRGTGITAPTITVAEGSNYTRYRTKISITDTVEKLRNANFGFTYQVAGENVVVHSISTSMGNGIKSCFDSFDNDTEGYAYIDFVVSAPTDPGTITINDLIISREF